MKRLLIICILAAISVTAYGSRIPEIEQYYIDKVSSLLKTRFPETPFTVFVQIDAGDRNKDHSRKKEIRRGDNAIVQLPYLEVEEEEEISVWNRTDIPLGTLIGLLEKVAIRIQIDSSVGDMELKDLQENIAKQLKLDANADIIEIAKVPFNMAEKRAQRLWIAFSVLASILATAGVFWWLSKASVKSLVKGLAQPISEIGKSTQEFANSALNIAADLSQPSSVADRVESTDDKELSLGSNLIEIRKSALELLQRNAEMFKSPDARFLSFLEQQGRDNPTEMGAILAELDQASIKSLYKFGWGDWWFTALASPAPLTPASIKILSEIDRLRLRWHFNDDDKTKSSRNKETGIIFGRLNEKELATVLNGVSIQDAEPLLHLLPRSHALSVAKNLYPGQWATLLDSKKKLSVLKEDLVDKLLKKALEVKPLRVESEIQTFFADLDLVKYLEVASPRDEKDFYMVLPNDSKIKSDRFPFYKVFEAPKEVKKLMGGDINAKDWASILAGCEQSDCRSMLDAFSDRLKFVIEEYISEINYETLDKHRVRSIRKAIIKSYFRNSTPMKQQGKDNKDDSTKVKAA